METLENHQDKPHRPREGRRRAHPRGLRERLFGILLLACVFAPVATAAQIAVVVATRGPEVRSPSADTSLLVTVLRERGRTVIARGSERLHRTHSVPLERTSDPRNAFLEAQLKQVTRDLALGELDTALSALESIEKAGVQQVDFLRRQPETARTLFDACIMTGYLLHQHGRVAAAEERWRMCASSFPGFRLERQKFTRPVRERYRKALGRPPPTVTLTVEAARGPDDCAVRLNGINVGRAPVVLQVYPGTTRVQLECGAGSTRIHTAEVTTGPQRIVIDVGLDAVLDTSDAEPRITYNSEGDLVQHLAALGRLLGAATVLCVMAHDGWLVALVDVERGTMSEPIALDPQAPKRAIDALFPHPNASPQVPEDPVTRPVEPRPLPPTDRSLAGGATPHDALWLGLGVMWIGSSAITGVVLASRRDIRRRAIEPGAELDGLASAYDEAALVGVFGAGLPGLIWAVSSPWLPMAEGVPWYAWLSGAAGTAILAAGLVVQVGVDSCRMAERDRRCGHWAADPLFGPLTMVHAAAPLSIPLAYAIANALSVSPEDVRVAVRLDDSGSAVVLFGRF